MNNIKIGDLCMYHDIPVIVLEKNYRYSSGSSKEGYYAYLCLFYDSADIVSECLLRKI